MNEDAFARRFYADRAELESLRIPLTVEKPLDGVAEQENYSLRPENFHLPAIEFTDSELAALATALSLLDGEFAYAEPLRLALQQITWGRPSPLAAPDQQGVALGITASAGGHELSQNLAKIETAIFRHKTITFDYYTMERDETGAADRRPLPPALPRRPVLPARPLPRARRAARLPPLADPRQGRLRDEGRARLPPARRLRPSRLRAPRGPGSSARSSATAQIRVAERIAWQLERHFGRFGEITPDRGLAATGCSPPSTRTSASWSPGCSGSASMPTCSRRRSSPAELERRLDLLVARHRKLPEGDAAPAGRGASRRVAQRRRARPGRDTAIRPERFARLVTLASILIRPGRAGERLGIADVCERLQLTELELREDISVLNVVNFGGGSYVLYAEVDEERHDRGRPRALQRHLRAPGAPAAGRGQGARRGDRSDRRAHPAGLAGLGAREHRRACSARTRWSRASRSRTPAADDSAVSRVISKAIKRPRAARARLLQGERGRVLRAAGRALRADQRPRGLVSRDLRPRQVRRPPLPPRPHPPRRAHEGALQPATRGQPGGRCRRLAAHRRGHAPRASRASGSRRSARAGRASSARSSASGTTGRSPSS